MTPKRLRDLLERVERGEVAVEHALDELRSLPYRDLGVAAVDHHRALRQGCPEVVYGEGKTAAQILAIANELVSAGHNLLVTRIDEVKAEALARDLPGIRHAPIARAMYLEQAPPNPRPCAPVGVLTAGTSDLPVAEEAALTLESLGFSPSKHYDIGVAGLHRLLGRSDELARLSAVIVIAGMEGALPSVVGGLVACPVVAVPTSVGYGSSLGGFTALFSMLTSCASGVTVVNIDNGFGAAMAIHRMAPRG